MKKRITKNVTIIEKQFSFEVRNNYELYHRVADIDTAIACACAIAFDENKNVVIRTDYISHTITYQNIVNGLNW